jgi:membrane-bound lytic murein transglycosylase D
VVRIAGPTGTHRFGRTFAIGREEGCEVRIEGSARVSRRHTEVRLEDGAWWVVDLGSSNGTFLDGNRIERAPLAEAAELRLGDGGPVFELVLEGAPAGQGDGAAIGDPVAEPRQRDRPAPPREARSTAAPPPDTRRPAGATPPRPASSSSEATPPEETENRQRGEVEDLSLSRVASHYFGESDQPAGERTMFIRKAFAEVQDKQRRQYGVLIIAALAVGLVAVAFAGWQTFRSQQMRSSAEQIFYQLREMDMTLATYIAAEADISPEHLAELIARRQRAAEAYQGFVEELGVYRGLSQEERYIYNVARIFNESEFSIPGGFVREVQTYIRQWQRSNRFQLAVQHAESRGKTAIIVRTLQQYGLPPEFFYLAMQESNFNARAVGPWTRWGHAKGAWQFIPSTGEAYGLRSGPRVDDQVYDPQDQRHDFEAATVAAARYLLDIYTHLAQASGLLVCASYNWGEHRVAPRLDQLPPPGMERARAAMAGIPMNPQERSYWRFYTEYADRMPDETKGYVMNIFAAAVIGQNPRFFGIDMDNPLAKYLEAPLEEFDTMPAPPDEGGTPPPAPPAGPDNTFPHPQADAPPPADDAPRRLGRDALRGQ